MSSVSLQGRQIEYSQVGTGAPVLFVHGSFATSAAWRRVLSNLDLEKFSAIAIDLPGSGASDEAPLDSVTQLEHEVAAIETVLTEVGTEPVHVVGHSYGGVVVLALALGGRVSMRSLTLFETLPMAFLADTGDAALLDEMLAFMTVYRRAVQSGDRWAARLVIDFWGGTGAFDAMPLATREAMADATMQIIRQWEGNMAFQPTLDAYRSMRVPTVIVRGGHAIRFSRIMSERLHELIPQSKVIEIAGAGHFMIYTHALGSANIISRTVDANGSA